MTKKDILVRGLEIVSCFITGFGGQLLQVAPPGEAESRYAVVIVSFIALGVLLLLSALARRRPPKRVKRMWIVISAACLLCAIASAVWYKSNRDRLTFPYPPEALQANQIAGTVLTPAAQAYLKENPSKTVPQLVAAFGIVNVEMVWTAESIRHSKALLTWSYALLLVCLFAAVFTLIECVLGTDAQGGRKAE